jgi:hypothetical protein
MQQGLLLFFIMISKYNKPGYFAFLLVKNCNRIPPTHARTLANAGWHFAKRFSLFAVSELPLIGQMRSNAAKPAMVFCSPLL